MIESERLGIVWVLGTQRHIKHGVLNGLPMFKSIVMLEFFKVVVSGLGSAWSLLQLSYWPRWFSLLQIVSAVIVWCLIGGKDHMWQFLSWRHYTHLFIQVSWFDLTHIRLFLIRRIHGRSRFHSVSFRRGVLSSSRFNALIRLTETLLVVISNFFLLLFLLLCLSWSGNIRPHRSESSCCSIAMALVYTHLHFFHYWSLP